ncbi:hypothetical protein THAOC_22085 [Thalassiosira oceanica]|uniref:Uncharacterized protein n=1 Tax=Thalassiosira oceanica TaxID=159749 RepID=K0RVJ0_THAOC|nr:hypothetical protein THAOC_22085 [Thalassiosira oceanica]|eukprot:EJK57833.1 hypothetical protein THAOC_22085 [Thalassiosira oceanica]
MSSVCRLSFRALRAHSRPEEKPSGIDSQKQAALFYSLDPRLREESMWPMEGRTIPSSWRVPHSEQICRAAVSWTLVALTLLRTLGSLPRWRVWPSPGPLHKTQRSPTGPKTRRRGRALQTEDFQQAETANPVPPSSRTPITGVPIQRIWAEESNSRRGKPRPKRRFYLAFIR